MDPTWSPVVDVPVDDTLGCASVRLLALEHLRSHALAGRTDVPPVRLYLREGGPGLCLHEPLRHHGPRGAALERWVGSVGDDRPDDVLPHDAVHVDLHPGTCSPRAPAPPGSWTGTGPAAATVASTW